MGDPFAQTLLLTARLALTTTLLLLVLGVPLAWVLSRIRSRWRSVLEAVIALPLVLPPTVLGFYLLWALSPGGSFGAWLRDTLGVELLFSFEGLVLGSLIYSLPFMVQPVQEGFEKLPRELSEIAYTLGASRLTAFFRVELPNVRPSMLTGAVLSFAHTVGEFGLILMIGGNIPGETRVASIAIYDAVEGLQYGLAHRYSAVLLVFSFVVLVAVRVWRR
jgi:molybdate transport system permease protein